MNKVAPAVSAQIKKALDGRTQRWLSFEIRMPEQDLSKKMNGVMEFTDKEIADIEQRLNCKIER